MSWRWISIAALLAALVMGFGALTQRGSSEGPVDTASQLPAYYLKDSIVTVTQPDGSAKFRLIAARIEQQPRDDSFTLTTVRADYLNVPDKHWVLSARQGFVPAASRIVQFTGEVELRPADALVSTWLRTEELTVDTEKNLAYTTTSPVRIRSGRYSLNAQRFEVDLTTEKIRMESVHGRSEPG